ncbi:hypothetical protein PHET_03978, partial [Paragonimus heterotremus]
YFTIIFLPFQTLERNGLLGVVSTLIDWKIVIPSMPADSGYPIPYVDSPMGEELPLSADIRTVESWLSSASSRNVDRGYYWTAPKDYLGKQIAAYRNHLIVILRFNSPTMVSLFGLASAEVLSGRTPYNSLVVRDQLDYMWLNEPDVVLEGNGYRLAYILPVTHRDSHLIIDLRLHESSFRVLVEPPSSVPVDRIPIGMSQGTVGLATGQFGDPVRGFQQAGRPATVADLIAVLSKLDRLLIKAKYISDQNTIELRQVRLVRAERDPEGRIPGLEECICPAGHTGTSCESCAFGYWRDPNRKSEMDGNRAVRGMWRDVLVPPICIPCECNGHSAHCDEQTGRCIDCQHNTAGDKCDRCAPGFYGDPSSGSPNACRPCECPTLTDQKTESCIAHETALSTDMKPYICLDCEDNTRGRYCERCAQGYYGQPDKGISCRLCDCDRGAVGCNETTGQCICGYNTAGPRCEACAEGTHGNPLIGQACRPCNCHEKGSVSLSCRAGDGQCFCNPGYEGLRCDRCTAGRGNVDAGCPPCQCSPIGTRPEARSTCDPTTGQCACKPGVGGTLDCSKCAPGFYNLGPNGCQECECSNRAVDLVCDPMDGRCKCGTNVVGDRCEKCKSGHFWNVTGPNCLPCECGVGTAPSGKLIDTVDCDMQTGQCTCAPHVTGRQCTECEPGYYGVSSKGCKPCPMCPNGQVCDQVTGKCICPPNTQGDRCEECSLGSWDYNPITGCKMCNCSLVGTKPDSTQSCDSVSGQCQCQQGYAGRACDQCETGHYGYPDCKPCECDARGTLRANGTVLVKTVCNQTDGSCFCKPNVQDIHCDMCKPSTFGLNIDYPLGCYSCFCFPTSIPAKCSLLTGYRSVPGKEKGIEIIATDRESVPGGALIQLSIGLKGEVSDDLSIGVSQFSWRFSAHRPTFLEVPELRGQLTRNYGTVLIAIITECLPTGDCALNPPDSPYSTEMLVANGGANIDTAGSLIVRRPYRIDARMIALNGQLHLEYQPADDAHGTLVDGYRQIWLREADWVLTRVVGVDTRVRPSRRELMLALLNVTSFSVRLFMPEANPKLVSVKYRVYEALSETATLAGTQIRSVEKCDCPVTSSGDHCEVASSGFYFPELVPKPGPSILPPQPDVLPPTVPENIIWRGGVEKCRCHGMSSRCDPNTGVCEACTGNTMGPDCGQCTTGYMGDPKKGQPCVKCQCPTEQTDYAITCFPAVDRPYVSHQCVCKPGYSGLRCERCAPGYFGDPTSMIACQPCDCDMDGSKSASCAQDTGQCSCWPGIFGRRCDQCEPDHVVDAGRCLDCRGECTGELLIKADSVKTHIDNLNVTSLAYQGVARLSQQADSIAKRFSPERIQKEEDLIQQVQQLARETSMARDATDQARRMRDTLELARCQAQENLTRVNQAIERLDTRVKDWIDRVQELPLTTPDSLVLQRWLEEARRVRTELNAIKLNATHDAMSKLQKEVEKVIESAKDLTQTVRPGRSAIELRRLEAYQQQQRKLLELQTTQLYGIGNATQKASKELGLAQTKSNALKKAATDAADLNTIHKFETNVTKLRALLDSMSELPSEEVQKLVDNAKRALQNITSVDLIDLDRIHIPPNLESDVIQPLEKEADGIRLTLQFSTKVNQTIQALDAYQTIIDNMRKATNATMQAEDALKESAAAESQTWQELLEQVTQKNEDIASLLDESAEVLQNHNKTLNLATKQLVEASSDLDEIQKTADKTLSDAQEVNSKINVIKQLLTDTEPQAQNVSAMTGSQMEKMTELRDRLQSVENRYAKLQGTAQSTVDQANNTLLNLVKSISETETTVKQLDTKLLRLRRLADEARSLLDVSYGALAKDPVPLRLNRDCVYSLVPYALTKSRVFDIEFWFRLHPEQSQMNSVLMIGRRAFAGRTQMFAFTLESSNTKLRFSWNVINGKLELNAIRTGIWYQVRVTSVSGETRMMLIERPDEEKLNSNSQPTAREVSTRAGANHPEAALMLDRQMEIRIGGALQPGSRLVNPEAWGVNGAETLWSRLLSMDATQFCIFNLRVGGVAMSIVDLATASPSCKQPSRLDCQLFNYRPLARNGYVWRPQNELTDVTNETRPPQSLQTNYLLKRLFYYDFAGTGGYARIEEFKDLKFCEDRVQFQLTPLTDAQRNPMMVFTFFNYDKDTGVTVELVKGIPKATKWTGDQLYRSQHEPGLLDATEVFRRRVLRTTSSSDYGTRVRRNMGTEDKRAVSITQSELTVRIWRLDELLPTDCTDKVVMFLGAIPPGHYSLRRRMTELGLTLNPFVGRIGITNEKPSQDGSLFLEEYVNAPVARLGDTHFTDLQQRGEAFVVSNLRPDLQYCLQFSPDSVDTRLEVDELKLDKSKLGSPWEPGITMTVRFNPTVTPTEDIVLLRLQMASAEWLTISITPEYRLGLGIPGATSKLFTQESLTDRPLDDPAYALNELEMAEARMINASIPAWKELTSSEADNLDSGLPLLTTGKFEVTITLHFGKANSQRLHVLFDQRLVQSWTIPSQANVGPIEQALIGPFTKVKQPITISYLLIGTHLVDFAAELSIAEGKPGVHIGVCGGQLHPRFLRRVGPLGILWVAQGLDLAPPPGGRRLRFVEMLAENATLPDVSQLPSMPADSRLRREEDCATNPSKTAWFDQTANSFWEINDLGSRLEDIEPPFEFTIGFRAQLSQESKAMMDPDTSKVENAVAGVQYNLLAAFNYGPERGNLYILLSESQIIVTDSKRVLWSSPHLTISDSSWHRLTLAIPKNDILNDLNGVESGVYIIFDGRHLWLPKVSSNGVPILAFIGGLPSTLKLTLPPNENIAPVTNMFGCVDELVINGIEINPRISGRPTCYDCFSLDPNMIHVPESIRNYMKTELIPLQSRFHPFMIELTSMKIILMSVELRVSVLTAQIKTQQDIFFLICLGNFAVSSA